MSYAVLWSISRNSLEGQVSKSANRDVCVPTWPHPTRGWSMHVTKRLGVTSFKVGDVDVPTHDGPSCPRGHAPKPEIHRGQNLPVVAQRFG
jgi:hypothetical protein